ncbi:nuclease-related domain-containing protein [Solibacillus sp. CAU 1738]|uniref:nuclease-related domain-containing protein n=1 Tax=Solibacillus sp. CAU 1738 TaxID=3140363 RepID=UPI003260D600
MILLERFESLELLLLESLERRDSNEEIIDLLRRTKSGLAGERRVDTELNMCLENDYIVLRDLVLHYQTQSFQMDCLLLSPHFAFVIEVKNMTGRIEYSSEQHQFIRIRQDGTFDCFTNPIDQVRRHQTLIEQLFRKWNITLPVESAVIFASRNVILPSIQDGQMYHVTGLSYESKKLYEKHRSSYISNKQLLQLGQMLLKLHTPRIKKVSFNRARLRKGVLCSRCKWQSVMRYERGSWRCRCGVSDNTQLRIALHDYRLLWNEKISNSEFREFTKIDCADKAYYLLKKLGLDSEGKFKDKKYIIPANIWSERKRL